MVPLNVMSFTIIWLCQFIPHRGAGSHASGCSENSWRRPSRRLLVCWFFGWFLGVIWEGIQKILWVLAKNSTSQHINIHWDVNIRLRFQLKLSRDKLNEI